MIFVLLARDSARTRFSRILIEDKKDGLGIKEKNTRLFLPRISLDEDDGTESSTVR